MSLPPAYPHQTRTVDAVRRSYVEGARAICVVVPTGGGKTWIGSKVVEGAIAKGRRVLWLAHREELVDQAAASLARLGVEHGLIKAGRAANPNAPIQVASVQTLTARPASLPPADIIVPDETHHAVAKTWQALLGRYPRPELILGLTATPERADGKPLGRASGGVFERMVAETSVAELQRTLRPDGHPILVPCDVVGPAKQQDELWKEPVQALLDHARRPNGTMRPTILFAASVAEAQTIADRACAAGIRAACVDGKTPTADRKARLEAFARRELDLLTNVMVLTEGFDVPATEVCAVARGCGAVSTWLQMIGRAIRSSPETGKARALLIDYRGTSYQHGLVEWDRTFSLEGKAIQTAGERPSVGQCKACGAVFTAAPRCPRCGAACTVPRRSTRVRQTETVQITPDRITPTGDRRKVFEALCETARQRGYKPGWVGMQFKSRFGHWPPWPLPSFGRAA